MGQSVAVGGLEGLLQVGEDSNLRPLIEEQLGDVPLAPQGGHDGQIYYAVALDLDGDSVPPLLDHAAYRYRRIAYPAISSLFGLLDGRALLFGMITTTVLASAIAAGLTAAFSVRASGSEWLALAVVANPGVWLSVRLLTADIAALALMILGLWWLFRPSRLLAPSAFALSTLAKDVFLTTPAGLTLTNLRARWRLLVVPAVSLLAWMTWLTIRMGEGFTGRGNLAWPLMGLIEASDVWGNQDFADILYLVFAVASVLTGLVASFRRSWLRWPIVAWSVLGVISSSWVWDLGNNAARVFSPIAVLLALSFLDPGPLPEDERFETTRSGLRSASA